MVNIAFDSQGNRFEARTTADWANADLVVSIENGIARIEKVDQEQLIASVKAQRSWIKLDNALRASNS